MSVYSVFVRVFCLSSSGFLWEHFGKHFGGSKFISAHSGRLRLLLILLLRSIAKITRDKCASASSAHSISCHSPSWWGVLCGSKLRWWIFLYFFSYYKCLSPKRYISTMWWNGSRFIRESLDDQVEKVEFVCHGKLTIWRNFTKTTNNALINNLI